MSGDDLLRLRLADLQDLGITARDEALTLLSFVSEQTGKQPGRGRGWSIVSGAHPKALAVSQWTEDRVQQWLQKTHRSRYMNKLPLDFVLDGSTLLNLQRDDLLALGVKDGFEMKRFLLDITMLVVADPVDSNIPFSEWSVWQLRYWLIRNGKIEGIKHYEQRKGVGYSLSGDLV